MARTVGPKVGKEKLSGRATPAPARPKGARRTTPSPETLAQLGPDRLIGLILGETARNPAFRKLVSAALAALQGPDAVAAIVDRRLTALEGARGFIDWQKRRAFTLDLDATVRVILEELRPLDAVAAAERLKRFLTGSGNVLGRVDDGSGATQGVYDRAGDALVAIAAALPPPDAARIAEGLLPSFLADPYGGTATALFDLVAVLPAGTLSSLDARIAEGVAPKKASGTQGTGMKGSGMKAAGSSPFDPVRTRALRLRQAIADRRGDVEAYIAFENGITPQRPDRVAVARRLLDAGQGAEALDWIRRPSTPGLRVVTRADLIAGFDAHGPERARRALEIEILDALGRGNEAQDLRWRCFAGDLDGPMLRAYLAKLPDFEDEEALLRALDHAESFADPHRALGFLVAWPDLVRAAGLVIARADVWRGDDYGVLAPAADALAADHPLAATILYRRLLDAILPPGHSAAYAHGARYLRELDALGGRLEPGAIAPDPDAYRHALRRDHGRKRAFWTLLGD